MDCKEFYFKGKEDLDIHVYKWTSKIVNPKAVVQIAHGMSETAIRYEEFAKQIDKAIFPGTQGGPLMHIIAAKAVCFGEALKPEFKEYGKKIVSNCKALADGLLKRGNKLVSGGTDNHVLLMDLRDTDVTGKELEARLDDCYITVNKNTIPGEPRSPFVTSGVRIGTAAVTTRGLNEEDMDKIAEYITLVLNDYENSKEKVRAGVEEICKKYPLYE